MTQPELNFAPVVMGKIHAARLDRSPRLQRLNAFLADGLWHSTRDIVEGAHIMAVSSAVTELRANGISVETRGPNNGIYEYRRLM